MKNFKGCLRNFKMNGKAMNAPQQKHGVLPCLDVPMDAGIYFFNEGGYITIGKLCGDYGIWNCLKHVGAWVACFYVVFQLSPSKIIPLPTV